MSDARAQELLRLIGEGDPQARVALFKHLARTGDPALLAATQLRTQLRGVMFGLLDQTHKAAYVPFAPLVANLAAALESRASESCGFAYRTLGKGSWHQHTTSGLGTLVACLGERVLIGIGGATGVKRGATPGAIWHELGGLQMKHKPATNVERIEAWALFEERRNSGYMCWGQEVVETTRAIANDLCRFEAYAGPAGYGLWSELDSTGLRDLDAVPKDSRPLGRDDAKRLAKHLEQLGPEDLRGLLQEFVGHQDAARLSRPESKHLLALLQAWSGTGEGLSQESVLRVRGYQARLRLSEVRLTSLLNEVAAVSHLEEVRQSQLDGLIKRLRELEAKRGIASEPRAPARACSGEWLDVSRDDSVLERPMERPNLDLQRSLGAQWQGRVSLAARYADVAPIRSEPRERWRAKLPGREPMLGVAASPLVVVALSKKRTILLCPETGAIRAELPRAGGAFFMAEVLVMTLARQTLGGFDPLTGELLWQARCGSSYTRGQVARDLFLTGGGSLLKAFRFEDPRSPPIPAWSVKDGPIAEVRGLSAIGLEDDHLGVLLTDRHLVAARPGSQQVMVLDTEGAQVRVAPGRSPILADATGYLCSPDLLESEFRRPLTVGIHDFADGKCRWELETLGLPLALAPEVVYFSQRGRLVARSRALGSVLWETGDEVPLEGTRSDVFACRDVIVVARRHKQEIEAFAEGERLWTYATKKKSAAAHPPYPKLAPGFGRLHALVSQREIVCLEPS